MERNKSVNSLGILMACLLLFFECSRVPVTGRRQFDLLPDSQVHSLANDQYEQFIRQSEVETGTEHAQMVQRTGENIALAVERYFLENDMANEIEDYEWEFNLIRENTINAFAMPGGKIAVFTGIMDVAQSDNGLAVIMGHEIGHVVAKHGNERMSQMLSAQLGGVALSVALRNRPQQTQNLFMAAFGVGTQVGILLPYSRLHESEADRLGLIFMAMAGYDPRESVGFWQRMAEAAGGPGTPELLSTHPSPESRIQNLQEYMDEAMEYYQAAAPVSRD